MKTLAAGSLARGRSALLAVAVLLLVGLHGCDSLPPQSIPGFSGPSELSLSLNLRAEPDFVVANNGDAEDNGRAVVTATLRDANGSGIQGRRIIFDVLNTEGLPADQGELRTQPTLDKPNGDKSEEAVTDGGGNARLVYWSPARTDFTADGRVLIGARPEGTDANGAIYRTVAIEVRNPEPRLFPQDPGNTAPLCDFAVQPFPGPENGAYPVFFQVLFQTLASDSDGFIVRYNWDFGDEAVDDQPDVNHAWSAAGFYTVTHTVTDDDGAQTFCTFPITIN
jgi:hypothetical protein